MNFDSLEPPYLYLSIATPKEFAEYAYRLNYDKGSELAVRVVRGHKMRRLCGLYDEFAAAFQFPDYFGENWDALDECLADLEWLPAAGYVLFVSNTVVALGEEPEKQFATFVSVLSGICEEWARANTPKPFHVLLQCMEGDVENLRRRAQSPLATVSIQLF
ncbi:MAG: barstar family protein [Terriglobales bacterium]